MPESLLHLGKRRMLNPLLSSSFAICTALSVVAACGLVIGARRIVTSDREDRRIYEAIGRLEETRSSMRSAVSNMRDYMLSEDSVRQQASLSDIDDARDNLNQFGDISGGYQLVSRLQATISAASARMSDVMSRRAEITADSAAKLADDAQMNELFDSVDSAIGDQLTSQTGLVEARREKRQDDFLLTEIAFFATLISGLTSLSLAAISLRRESTHRRAVEVQHANVKQDLLTIQAMLELSDQKDELTGLLNRDAFDRIFDQEYEKNRKNKHALSLVIVDLDQIAQVREVRGKGASDELLRKGATVLKDSFRGGDVCCRFSETEFAIILPRTILQNGTIAAERARSSIEHADWSGCTITASLGVAQADFLKDRLELIARAQQAVDYARRTGRNRVTAIRAYLPMSA